jgi:hypothetical protein
MCQENFYNGYSFIYNPVSLAWTRAKYFCCTKFKQVEWIKGFPKRSHLPGDRSTSIKPNKMKKAIYALVLLLVVVSGLVFANRDIKNEIAKKPIPRPLTAAEIKAGREQWEATPGGIAYKKWGASPEGKKVLTNAAKLSKYTTGFTNMEAVVTDLSLPPGSRLGFGVMARINGDDYIVTFEPEKAHLEQLRSLKVNDKLIIRSRTV